MSDFSEKQLEIIDCFFRTGKLNNQLAALVLPALVNWAFKEKPELKETLVNYYGLNQTDVMRGLGSDLLSNNSEAKNLLEAMLSKVRKEH